MITLFSQAALIILVLVTLLWIWSVFIKNVSIVDNFWGMGFVLATLVYFLHVEVLYTRLKLVLLLVVIWGLRLSIHLMIRNYAKGEDYRYREFRQRYGAQRYWWLSFFQVFLLLLPEGLSCFGFIVKGGL